MPRMEERIQAENLGKDFDQFVAVDGVNLSVCAGEVLVLLGPNGAGKTTTVRMLTSILRPTRGSARVAGYDVIRQPDQVRASVGVLTEHHGLYGRMNARDYLDYYGQLYGLSREHTRRRATALLLSLGLGDVGKKRLGEYSKGMRQKLALVRALLHDPAVLLLDEPTSAMDPESARLVRESIRELRTEERSIVLCTHNLAEAEALADQIAIIRQGRIVLAGPLEQVKRDLLGPAEYIADLAEPGGALPELPNGITLAGRDANSLRFAVVDPQSANSRLLESLLGAGFKLVSLHERPRSLEQVYLEAMQRGENVH